ncbi:MAG: biopolymer transporter ExbD [Sedimenticola sp.]|uniref:Biopolymer transporter ExbD n=1 Tax=Sedimenticola thiotaurini TaxID=1543721 RepID=A0A558DGL6_9GAMM|nr:biopolymer transporter ExbD [Sedimenticola sp.]TVT60175.1 MAG: biopolymer transporter ExbD [Sedimenticola thiotaurini]MCW8881330.1 biopolymer transporter ExbD [Sedimenticola sp.]MCW8921518.1 biopolymer transporter ExbD [Sedimenticola sp.]MCW8947750.1 biopolymer transporter ExbD [Sedimenticola sp.]
MVSEPKRHSNVVLNLTPLIDIVFLLLVFFMLTAHFIEEERIDIQLPKASSSDPLENDQYVTVHLTPQGELYVDGVITELSDLTEVIKGALHSPEKNFVRLKGDQQAQFGKAVQIIDAVRLAGADALDIQTEKP